jgi:gliding motility-associated lipoprotein GldD
MHKHTFTILFFILTLLVTIAFSSCEPEFAPKPKGYFRIDFPKKEYLSFDTIYPYSFEYPFYSIAVPYNGSQNGKYWMNLEFVPFRATLHLSYFSINNDLQKHLDESRTLAYKHTVKAEAIDENIISFPDKRVFGTVYQIRGNAASTLQFYVTDSTKHFIRGAFYFNVPPNADSLAPVNDYITKDIQHFVSTLSWK